MLTQRIEKHKAAEGLLYNPNCIRNF